MKIYACLILVIVLGCREDIKIFNVPNTPKTRYVRPYWKKIAPNYFEIGIRFSDTLKASGTYTVGFEHNGGRTSCTRYFNTMDINSPDCRDSCRIFFKEEFLGVGVGDYPADTIFDASVYRFNLDQGDYSIILDGP